MKPSILYSAVQHAFHTPFKLIHTTGSVNSMKAWQAYQYGGPEVLELSTLIRVPAIQRPKDVLIKVEAASVNPIDARMLGGYGRSVVSALKCADILSGKSPDLPMTLGRDFIGSVVDFGRQVKGFKVGERVWGALPFDRPGCHAEYIAVCSSTISRAPDCLTPEEAASLPYVALTTQAAWKTAQVFSSPNRYHRALVLGGTGGIGSFAIQYLKYLGLEVITTCSGDGEDLMYELGCDDVVDYKDENFMERLTELKGFDFILDAAGIGTSQFYVSLLKSNFTSKYVTLTSPLLRDTDSFGLLAGTTLSAAKAIQDTFMGLRQYKGIRWAFFSPDGDFLRELAVLVDKRKIKPVVDHIFLFEDIKEAYNSVLSGHARGKTVIKFPN